MLLLLEHFFLITNKKKKNKTFGLRNISFSFSHKMCLILFLSFKSYWFMLYHIFIYTKISRYAFSSHSQLFYYFVLSLSLFLPFEWRWLCSIDHEIMKKTTTTKQQHLLDACSNWNETSNANIHLFMWSIWMLMSNLKRKSMSQVNCCWLKSLWFFFLACFFIYLIMNGGKVKKNGENKN